MKKMFVIFMAIIMLVGYSTGQAQIKKISPDPKGVELVTDLLKALSIEDEKARLAAVIPLVHKNLLSKDGKDLSRNIKDYSYKKACQGVKLYKQPADIYEVHEGKNMVIGFKETAEEGRIDKYFVNKKENVAGRPAPIHIFWPKSGGAPKINDMGSL